MTIYPPQVGKQNSAYGPTAPVSVVRTLPPHWEPIADVRIRRSTMMTARWHVTAAALALAAACASGKAGSGANAAPTPGPYVPASSEAPAAQPAAPPGGRAPASVRYGPSAVRYVVHRRLHIQQAFSGQQQAQDLGAHLFVAAAITGPADSVGYPATFLVDSVVADSGTPGPIVESLVRARRLVFSGRVVPRGEFLNAVPSDSVAAQSLIQILGNFRDFLPRIPGDGLKPGASWVDTVEASQKGSGSEISRRSIIRATAAAWEQHTGVRSLRLEGTATYQLAGAGQNAGQPFELSGAGDGTSVSFIADDGRYIGGESRDSANLTIRLPVQGVAIPVIQVTRTTVAVLP